jgi:pullulanase
MTLVDKITASVKDAKPTDIAQLSQLASSIAFLSQGMPFMQAGQEFLRSKGGDPNSYKSSDLVNSLKWSTQSANASTVKYFKGLISLRKAHPAFRMETTDQVKKNLKFLSSPEGTIAYSINGSAVKDSAATLVVVHNASTSPQSITLPKSGSWSVLVESGRAGTTVLRKVNGNTIMVAARSTLVLTQ